MVVLVAPNGRTVSTARESSVYTSVKDVIRCDYQSSLAPVIPHPYIDNTTAKPRYQTYPSALQAHSGRQSPCDDRREH